MKALLFGSCSEPEEFSDYWAMRHIYHCDWNTYINMPFQIVEMHKHFSAIESEVHARSEKRRGFYSR